MLDHQISSLYAHFPFCETRCHYCDFYAIASHRVQKSDFGRFERALASEMHLQQHVLSNSLKTIFLGGGTPSLTSAVAIEHIFAPIRHKINADVEWTMEMNPSSISDEALRSLRQLGVNRVSMGVQSLNPKELTLLGRVHSQKDVFSALDKIFEAGFQNVSVDVLCGVPGQNISDLESTLKQLLLYPVTHLSCYILTLPQHHVLYSQLPNELITESQYLFVHDYLLAAGFEHYEVSNFCKPRHEAQHNLVYWSHKSYLGLGPSAHSFDQMAYKRFKNISSLYAYCNTLEKNEIPIDSTEILNAEQLRLEKLMLGLRLKQGIEARDANRLQACKVIEQLVDQSLLLIDGNCIQLTPKGFLVMDQVVLLLFKDHDSII